MDYGSDLDMVLVYDSAAPSPVDGLSHEEVYARLAELVVAALSSITREGYLYRVDLRLRPQGREGEPAVGLSHALEYYAHRAHDWERQALIKARTAAGDQALGDRFIEATRPFVFPRWIARTCARLSPVSREATILPRRKSTII